LEFHSMYIFYFIEKCYICFRFSILVYISLICQYKKNHYILIFAYIVL
jgi:hypothetical protein